jgi:hypothetical protein
LRELHFSLLAQDTAAGARSCRLAVPPPHGACHEVENLLLEPSVLLRVLNFNGVDCLKDDHSVKAALLKAATSLESRFVAQWSAYRLYSRLAPDDDEPEPKPTDEDNLLRMARGVLKRATDAFSEAAVKDHVAQARAAIQKSYLSGTWLTVLPGKEMLEAFRVEYLSAVGIETLKEQIVSAMVESGFLPPEVQRLISRIKGL